MNSVRNSFDPSDPADVSAREVIRAATRVHKSLGPGLLERVYESALVFELKQRGVAIAQQVSLPVIYRGAELPTQMRLDLIVDECVVVEVKAVPRVLQEHHAQLLSYMRMANLGLGLLINFNAMLLKEGVSRLRR